MPDLKVNGATNRVAPFLRNTTAKRSCGNCALCCKLIPVSEIGKPKDTWCQHAVAGHACAIYDRRPTGCQRWSCAWLLHDDDFGPELKPDFCHVVVDMWVTEIGIRDNISGDVKPIDAVQLWVDARYPDAHRAPAVRLLLEKIAEVCGMPALARIGGRGVAIIAPQISKTGAWLEIESNLQSDDIPGPRASFKQPQADA